MVKRIGRLALALFILSQIGATCHGTETGNPTYSNDQFGVSAEYDSGWNATNRAVPLAEDTANGAPQPTSSGGIDTSSAPSTVFTDGTTTVTLFFVTLSEEPLSLVAYLNGVFSDRTFEYFSNSSLSGLMYDNPEAGDTGGDRREYYFLKGTTLLYVVTDLFEANDGFAKFDTLIDSIRFE